ncbi:MAG: DUF1850 domain-containing protein [Gemmobacter sp.]|nr:DUF1850 domain-containing protein [Gemmobacter sp.]
MSGCLMAGGLVLALATPGFTLDWTHSVERTIWREDWALVPGGLRLVQAAIKGSGAGVDPGPGARLVEGWWVWAPEMGVVPSVALAASGATGGGWRLCSGGRCHDLGAAAGEPLVLAPCAAGGG